MSTACATGSSTRLEAQLVTQELAEAQPEPLVVKIAESRQVGLDRERASLAEGRVPATEIAAGIRVPSCSTAMPA